MYDVTMKQLLEAGIHFGHQTKRWNPKMRPYIYTQRNGIYVMDLQQTLKLLKEAYNAVVDVTKSGGTIMFVGTKKQAQDSIAFEASRCGMPYVNQRWLGGTLTNFETIKKRIAYRNELEAKFEEGGFTHMTKQENQKLRTKLERLNKFFYGLRDLKRPPDAIFIIDLKKEQNAVHEAKKLKIPVIGIIDTNCDPDDADFPIPGNDDAIRAIKLFCQTVSNAVVEGREGQDALQAAMEEGHLPTDRHKDEQGGEKKADAPAGEAKAEEKPADAPADKPAAAAPAAEAKPEAPAEAAPAEPAEEVTATTDSGEEIKLSPSGGVVVD